MLLAIAKLTFDKAFELVLLHKSAAQNACMLSNLLSATTVHFADLPDLPKDLPSRRSCYRFGGSHPVKDCRFKDTVCNYCHKDTLYTSAAAESDNSSQGALSPPSRKARVKKHTGWREKLNHPQEAP